ncbi:uncharacterized protein LOC141907751 [Tubulanus polymorphus]|uniref:uncharacterized protein LOC141907751 n=1 Tax=Tubulanus polymorphus TaxID=672921 RepID=UPI003DA5303E
MTSKEITGPRETAEHSHCRDMTEIEVTKARFQTKKRAENTREIPIQIHSEIISRLNNPDVQSRLPHADTCKKVMQRVRRKKYQKDPATHDELFITDTWSLTREDGEEFLMYDNASTTSRIMILATDICLKKHCEPDTWFMDGNFQMAPTLFEQLYVIHVPLANSAISTVYAFLQRKTQETYEEFLTVLCEKCDDKGLFLSPKTVVIDFELAVLNATKSVFSDIEIRGCFYHLSQCIYRKIQNLGLATMYRDDKDFQLFCGYNFVSTYRKIRAPGGLFRLKRVPPQYPPKTWNMHTVTINSEDRTNKLSEALNNKFRIFVGTKHPSIWRAIECLQQENCVVETLLAQMEAGNPPKKTCQTKLRSATKSAEKPL